jgi:protein LSM14
VTKLEEYDFEKANLEFTELEKGISTLNVNDKEADAENENENGEEPAYDKQKSFFDAISCEALERSKGTNPRPDRRHERKLNEETFGVSGNFRNFRRGGYGGGRGYNNRGYGGRNYSNRGNYQRRGSDNRRRSANNGSEAGTAAAPASTATKAQTAEA